MKTNYNTPLPEVLLLLLLLSDLCLARTSVHEHTCSKCNSLPALTVNR